MRLHSAVWLPLVIALPLFAGCSPVPMDSEGSGSDGGDKVSTSAPSSGAAIEIIDFGFGYNDSSAQAMVVVAARDEAVIGEYVTVSVNFLDADGQILSTEVQVESFSWVGQEIAFPVRLYLDDLPGTSIVSIDPSVSVSKYGANEPSKSSLPELDASEISQDEYGNTSVSFEFTNEMDEDLTHVRVGVVCYDAAAKIIGGTSTYPNVAPAGKTIRVDADVKVSELPASCRALLNYDFLL